jgi:hypothetical protein
MTTEQKNSETRLTGTSPAPAQSAAVEPNSKHPFDRAGAFTPGTLLRSAEQAK